MSRICSVLAIGCWGLMALLTLTLGQQDDLGMPNMTSYCVTEFFQPECQADQVILMQAATYGRMHRGRCVEIDLGYLGCQVNVLRDTDNRCSGRRSCRIPVPDAEFEAMRPCLTELKSYLEAEYSCVDVLPVNVTQCEAQGEINITSSVQGFISSTAMSESLGCHGSSHPWVVMAYPGQLINLTLYDFAVPASYHLSAPASGSDPGGSAASPPRARAPAMVNNNNALNLVGSARDYIEICHEYGIVEDSVSQRTVKICGGGRRVSHVYLSQGNVLKIWITNAMVERQRHFLVEYTVIGCPDVVPPENVYFQRSASGSGAEMGCRYSPDRWELTCTDREWVGTALNCSGPIAEERDEEDSVAVFSFSVEVAFAIIVGAAVGIALVLFIVGFFRYRRSRRRRDVRGQETFALRSRVDDYVTKEGTQTNSPQQARLLDDGSPKYPLAHEMACATLCRHQRHQVRINGNEYEHIWESPLPLPIGTPTIKTDVHCTAQTHTLPRCSADTHLLPALTFSTFKAPDLLSGGNTQPMSAQQQQNQQQAAPANGNAPLYVTSKDIVGGNRQRELPYDIGRYSSLNRNNRYNESVMRQDL